MNNTKITDMKTFAEKSAKAVMDFYGGNSYAEVRTIMKNNGVQKTAVVLSEDSRTEKMVVYMEPFFENYMAGSSFGQVMGDVLRVIEESKTYRNPNMNSFQDYANVRPKLFLKAVMQKGNKAVLEKSPWEPFLDMALVPCIYLVMGEHWNGCIQVGYNHLKVWDITADQLIDDARKNGARIFKPVVLPIIDTDEGGTSIKEPVPLKDWDPHGSNAILTILTNPDKYLGASLIAYPEILEQVGDRYGNDFFILPSSIHEVLLKEDDGFLSARELGAIVFDSNRSPEIVNQEEVLSDSVYHYSRKDKKITIAWSNRQQRH